MGNSLQRNLPPMEVPSLERPQSTTVQSVDRGPSNPVHSVDRQDDWNQLPGQALGKAGISRKFAAGEMTIDASLLSAQLQGRKHLPWQRLYCLGREFAFALVTEIIRFYDFDLGFALSEQDRRDLELGRTLREALTRRLAR
jgi:hypothetical protein